MRWIGRYDHCPMIGPKRRLVSTRLQRVTGRWDGLVDGKRETRLY